MILAIFYLQVIPMLPTKFGINWPFRSEVDFQDGGNGGHLGFPMGTILATFYLQVTPMLPTKFQSSGLSFQEKKRKIDFRDGGHLGFQIGTSLAVLSTSHPDASYQVSSQLAFGFGEEAKNF